MKNIRTYGQPPYNVAVVHGGPGAAGEMAPVARELSLYRGVLEPLQTAASVQGQVEELHDVLKKNGDLPITLIGHSWGAWLSYLVAAQYPALIIKLILVGSGPFENKYANQIMKTRLGRLTVEEQFQALALLETLNEPGAQASKETLAKFGEMMSKADNFDPLLPDPDNDPLEVSTDIYQSIWPQAAELRKNGQLLKMADRITCPVIAIHGDYDPHPADGVKLPLSAKLKSFKFILLEKCGHTPWLEQQAKDSFYRILKIELP